MALPSPRVMGPGPGRRDRPEAKERGGGSPPAVAVALCCSLPGQRLSRSPLGAVQARLACVVRREGAKYTFE